MSGEQSSEVIVIIFKDDTESGTVLYFHPDSTLAQVYDAWHLKIDASPSVAFFSAKDHFYSKDMTVSEALQHAKTSSLELHTKPQMAVWLELFGFEESKTQFEVEPSLTPIVLRRQITKALDISTENFRLIYGETELDQSKSFSDLKVCAGDLLTVDLKARIELRSEQDINYYLRVEECFGSETIGDLRQRLQFTENQVIVETKPDRRLLWDALCLCHVIRDESESDICIELIVEEKVSVAFEPITLDHLRQELMIPPSATPLDLYDEVSRRFKLTCEFRLAVNFEPLEDCTPLIDQLYDPEIVIQIDIVRPCVVMDLWMDLRESKADIVYQYSTESSLALTMRNFPNDQLLIHDGINLTLFGNMLDVFGAIGGGCCPIILIDRDLLRSVPFLTLHAVKQMWGWSTDVLIEIAPQSLSKHPKEFRCYGKLAAYKTLLSDLRLCEESLVTVDSIKIFAQFKKRLMICRFFHSSKVSDITKEMQRKLNVQHLRLRTPKPEPLTPGNAGDLITLEVSSRYQTEIEVLVNNRPYQCRFEDQEVTFSSIMIEVGKQAQNSTRCLFQKSLFCQGCGRKISKDEELFQKVPAACCRVRSLRLYDRRSIDIGVQTTPRQRDIATETLNPETRDKGTIVDASTKYESIATIHPFKASLLVLTRTPDGEEEDKTVRFAQGTDIVDLSQEVFQPQSNSLVFCEEWVYCQNKETRHAVQCYSHRANRRAFVDCLNKRVPKSRLCPLSCRRFLIGISSSFLPTLPDHCSPIVFIRTDTILLTTNSFGRWMRIPNDKLSDPSFVAMTFGVRSGSQFFWELHTENFVSDQSERVLLQKEIPIETDNSPSKRHVVLLLQDGDRLPAIPTQWNGLLLVLKREGLDLRVENSCVKRNNRLMRPNNLELWEQLTG